MDRAEKKAFIEEMHNTFKGASTVVVAHYKGLSVAEMSNLRSKVRAAGATVKVTKNRLTKLALDGTSFTAIGEMLVGPTALAFSNDPVAAAKAFVEFAKDNEKLVVLGGAFGEKKLGLNEVQALAKMPSLDELRAKIVGMLQTPATRLACLLQAPAGQVARVINAHATKG